MQTTDGSGIRIAWEETGSGEPVLLVMGHAYPRGMWHRVVPALSPYYRVITFDNRGVGESEKPAGPYTIEQMAADSVAVLDAAGVESAHIYGVSLGGLIVEEIALTYPERVRSLIVGCSGAMSTDKIKPPPKGVALLMGKVLPHLPPKLRLRITEPFGYGPNRDKAKVAEDRAIIAGVEFDMVGIEGQAAATAAYRSSERVGAIRVPTLVLHGDADRMVTVEWGKELAALIPGAKLIIYPGAGHNYITDATEQSNADVLSFLKSVREGAAQADS